VVEAALTAGKRVESRATSLSGPVGQRAFDVVLAALILVLCAPVMLLTALAIYLEDGGPIFYVQPRVGRYARTFSCLKFSWLMLDAETRIDSVLSACPQAQAQWSANRKLTRDPRVTRVGRVIRRRSLDELPQLINVLKGDMSVVGPRPIMLDERKLYGRRLGLYTQARPGITGLWQVSGRGDASFRSRIAMDMVYLRGRRLRLDLTILARTVPAVLWGRGSY
jgi:lipopolysaccharide/colanic/teichoic acid biosynthesis glycosyltransferase